MPRGMGISLLLDTMKLTGHLNSGAAVRFSSIEDMAVNESLDLHPFTQSLALGHADFIPHTSGFLAKRLPHVDYTHILGYVNVVIVSRKGLELGYGGNFFVGIFDNVTYGLIIGFVALVTLYLHRKVKSCKIKHGRLTSF